MPDVFQPGARIDRYAIVREVASGGMGTVWQAELAGKHGFAKKVAIKTIRPELAGNATFKAMFLEEARISSRLSHANVAQVLDVGEQEGTVYIVFEWVEGRSLEGICKDAAARGEAVSLELVLRVVADVCAGLHALHELRGEEGQLLNAVHRDVSPSNVLVSHDGYAKIIDFGLAKARDRAEALTKSGVVKGTPQFMAPEQAMGQPIDRRADVFSTGALLYRAFAGRAPFPNTDALAAFVLGKGLPPLPDEVPEAVRELILKAMCSDPEERFATAAEMRRALERATHVDLEAPRPALAPTSEPLPPTQADARSPVDAPPPIALTSTQMAPVTPTTKPSKRPVVAPPSRWLVVLLVVAACVVAVAVMLAFRA